MDVQESLSPTIIEMNILGGRHTSPPEIHEVVCGSHEGARTIAKKAFMQGLFQPIVVEDAKKLVK